MLQMLTGIACDGSARRYRLGGWNLASEEEHACYDVVVQPKHRLFSLLTCMEECGLSSHAHVHAHTHTQGEHVGTLIALAREQGVDVAVQLQTLSLISVTINLLCF
jgi:hypothetical protein